MNENEDIRWYSPEKGRKCTYIESLKAELKHKNGWIMRVKWAEIEAMLPSITEDEAKKMCFWIRDEIRSEVRYHQTLYG